MLVIRADATPEVGAGHVMRCLTLAEAWLARGTGSASLMGEVTLGFVEERLKSLGVQVDSESLPPVGSVLVVDSYDERVRQSALAYASIGLKVLVDDLGGFVDSRYDLVWNPNPYGNRTLYPDFDGALVTGPEAVPIRSGLPAWRGERSRRIGVALGGGRPAPGLIRRLEELAEGLTGWRFVGVGDWVPSNWDRVPTTRAWEGLAACDRLLLAAGTMTWEAARVGIPVVLLQTADNQAAVVHWAARQGVPTLDLVASHGETLVVSALEESLWRASRLPRIEPGGEQVVKTLLGLMRASDSAWTRPS